MLTFELEDFKHYELLVEAYYNATEDEAKCLMPCIDCMDRKIDDSSHPCLVYLKALILNRNGNMAIEEYEKEYERLIILSSSGGCRESQYIYANRLYEDKEYVQAISLYKKSALQGYAPAQWCYGIDMFNGIEGIIEKNKVEGLQFIEYSAGQLYEYALDFLTNAYLGENDEIVKNTQLYNKYSKMKDWKWI